MRKMTKDVDHYFSSGCGRCELYDTPQCRVHTWAKELKAIRAILLECGLQEESKWGVPCYTHQKKNIALIGAFKEYAALGFFKGALLKDEKGLLTAPGENSQAARQLRMTDVKQISKHKDEIKSLIFEAIEIENSGKKITFKKIDEFPLPEELENIFKKDSAYKKAFNALTPGRQRGYLLHFNQAKQSATRISRIEKCRAKIIAGKGMQDY